MSHPMTPFYNVSSYDATRTSNWRQEIRYDDGCIDIVCMKSCEWRNYFIRDILRRHPVMSHPMTPLYNVTSYDATSNQVWQCMYRALLQVNIAYVGGYADPLSWVRMCRALLQIHRALLSMYTALLQVNRAFLGGMLIRCLEFEYVGLCCRYIGLFCWCTGLFCGCIGLKTLDQV